MNNINYNKLYKAIKLEHEGGECYKGRDLKLNQLQDYKIQMDAILKKISRKQSLHLIECCAGNCFLTFYLAWHYKSEFGERIRFTCIERNTRLLKEARKTAEYLALTNIDFITGNVEDTEISGSVHVVYSLHACDSATDATIALGVNCRARYIVSVSCCQHTMHKKIKGHPLTVMTRHGIYKEHLAHMAADTMRGCYISRFGYEADIFAFTAVKNTGRNIMLRAKLSQVSDKRRIEEYENYNLLKSMFRTEPELALMLESRTDITTSKTA